MKKFPRTGILIMLTVCLALAALGAELFTATHLDHDCDGLDCQVCLQIESARNLLKGLGLAITAAFLAGFTVNAGHRIEKIFCRFIRPVTPVTLNVKSLT
jgi:hypothetical protein